MSGTPKLVDGADIFFITHSKLLMTCSLLVYNDAINYCPLLEVVRLAVGFEATFICIILILVEVGNSVTVPADLSVGN